MAFLPLGPGTAVLTVGASGSLGKKLLDEAKRIEAGTAAAARRPAATEPRPTADLMAAAIMRERRGGGYLLWKGNVSVEQGKTIDVSDKSNC